MNTQHPDNLWTIDSADAKVAFRLDGRFPPDSPLRVSRDVSASSSSGPGATVPLVQDGGSGPLRWTFSASIMSRHNADDVRRDLAVLDRLAVVDPTLGRKPRIRISHSGASCTGLVTSWSKTPLGVWDATGLPKGASFDLEVLEAPLVFVEDAVVRVGETVFLTLGDADTYEGIAARLYGDPMKGEKIRAENPGVLEVAGVLVRALDPEHPRVRAATAPVSAVFGAGWEESFRSLSAARASQRGIPLDVFGA